MRKLFLIPLFCGLLFFAACKTKSELRREQDLERLKQEVSAVKNERADVEVLSDEVKTDLNRLGNTVEDHYQYAQRQNEDLKKEIASLSTRVQALEQRAVNDEMSSRSAPSAPATPRGLEAGKRFFEDGKYEEAMEALRPVAKGKKSDESRKAQYLLAEAHFSSKDFATAALEFGEYKKSYPKDPLVPNAIYRQANAFRSMNKPKEAKLFYQELIERFPKSNLATKAKQEMKKVK